MKRGLGLQPEMSGVHKICLNDSKSCILIYSSDPNHESHYSSPVKITLSQTRKCSHSDHFVCIEMGRACQMGSGDLIMQTQDSEHATSIHETIRECMKKPQSQSSHQHTRMRSSSMSMTDAQRARLPSTSSGSRKSSTASTNHTTVNTAGSPQPPKLSSVPDYCILDTSNTVSGAHYSEVTDGGHHEVVYHHHHPSFHHHSQELQSIQSSSESLNTDENQFESTLTSPDVLRHDNIEAGDMNEYLEMSPVQLTENRTNSSSNNQNSSSQDILPTAISRSSSVSRRPSREPSSLASFIKAEPTPDTKASLKSEFKLEPVESFLSPVLNELKIHHAVIGAESASTGVPQGPDGIRIRAHSTGSHMSHLRERLKFRMKSKLGSIDLKTTAEDGLSNPTEDPTSDTMGPTSRTRSMTVGSKTSMLSAASSLGASRSSSTSSVTSHNTAGKASSVKSESFDDHMQLDFQKTDD